MGVYTLRRYKLRKAQAMMNFQEPGLAEAYGIRHNEIPGTPLPVLFPSLEKLKAGFYTTLEDVNGADRKELAKLGIIASAASKVLERVTIEIDLRGPDKTPLAVGFPQRAVLVAAGYSTLESLGGYTLEQIELIPGLDAAAALEVAIALGIN